MSNIADAFNVFLSLPGLRGFWPLSSFDESGNAYDLSGNGQTLTYNGGGTGPTYNVNLQGTGYLDFDGTGDYLSRADAAHFDILGTESYVATAAKGLTLGGWFWFDNFSATSGAISKFAGTSGQHSYRLYGTTDATIGFQVSSDGTNTGLFNGESVAQSTGRWLFIVGRYDPSTELAVFVNKVKTTNTTSIPAAIFNSSSGFRIGAAAADNSGLLNGRGALCFLCAEVVSDALLDELYDESSPLFNIAISEAETVTLTETVSRRLVSQPKPAETVTLTEAQTVRMARLTSQAETVTLSETVSRNLVGQVKPAETVTLAEAQTANLVSQPKPAETVTLSEAATANMTRTFSTAETVTISESANANMPRSVSQNETVTLSEAQSLTVATARVSQNETVTLTEAQTVRVATATVSQNENVTLTEAQSLILADRLSVAETITLSEAGTTVLLVSVVGQGETVTLSEGVTVALAAFSVSAAETVTLGEILLVNAGSGLLITLSEIITLAEAAGVSMSETMTIVIYDTLGLTDTAEAPLFAVTDTLTLTDEIVGTITDTLTLTDEVTIGNVIMVIEDTLTFSEVLELDGPTIPPPAAAATSELDYRPVLKLLYGNDKRNPIRELDLAELSPGSIHLMAGGFAPGAGERNELWSGESIRFDGQKKLAESRKNSQLAVTCVLKTGGSQAALSYFQRKISRFFAEAKQHQLLGQNHTVWLEYRWSDGLPDLATPTFGQLSNYYEVFSATSPKWPDSLHDDLQSLTQGQIADVLLNITGSPSPEGLKQQAAIAAGTISLQDKGVLIASGASSKLHWAGYTSCGLTGNFTITGWITLNAVWGSGNKDAFDYYVDASNRIRIIYDAGNNRWTITKIVSGSTFTANSSTDAVTNGDDVHLQLVQDSTTLRLYVNGISAVSVTATNTMTDGGTVALGCPATGTLDGVDVILDGWRILPDDITATQALALYEAELPIKEDGGQVGPPPYFWTIDGLGQVNGADDSTYYNWGLIGGIGGDLEAKTDIRLNMADTASKHYWLGVKSQDETFIPSDYIWFEATGTPVVDAPSSEGGYHRNTGTDLSFTPSQTGLDPELILGKYHWLCRVRSSGPAVATVTPGWFFTNNIPRPIGRTLSVTNAAFKVLSFGDTFVETDAEPMIESSPNISLALRIAVAAATGVVFDTDFSFLLPAPFAKISQPDHASAATPSSSQPLVIEDGHAHIYTSVGRQMDRYEYQGDRLTARPNKYNYLFLVRLDANEEFTRANLTSIAVYVTPRYLLPGGMVA